MISVYSARERILAGLKPLGSELVALPLALGRVLAFDQASRVSHPPVAVSQMDGWAVRSIDVAAPSARLVIAGESAAGHPWSGSVAPGQAVRIFTGSAMPDGADAVVMQEESQRDGDHVTLRTTAAPGKFVRRAGLDFQDGDVLLRAGTTMGPRQIGLAAAMNLPWLPVHRRPTVAVMSTGDEIRMPGEPLGPAQIVGSNGPALAAMVEANFGQARQLGIAGDSREALCAMIAAAKGSDLLVISGGASVGDYDIVGTVLAEHGMKLDFWKVAMRPGKPLMFGRLGDMPVLGLPGNPVSALVCAVLFLIPVLRTMVGLPPGPQMTKAVLGRDLPANDEREDHLRASLTDAGTVVTPFPQQDSAVLSGLATADALVIRPPHAPAAKAGDSVPVLILQNSA